MPELPNIIEFLHKYYQAHPLVYFLHQWENLFFSLLLFLILPLFFYVGLRKKALIPRGLQNAVEFGMEGLQNVILDILGPQGRRHIPFLGTLFIYILSMNWLGIIPFLKSPSSDLSITAGVALCVFCYVQYFNIKNMGVGGFLYHLAGSPKDVIGWLLVPLMVFMELIAQISRPVTLALRLTGNMLGEHILMGVFAVLGIFWIATYTLPIIVPLQIPFVFLALFTGLMQAMVFTMLSTVYIFLSIPHKKEH